MMVTLLAALLLQTAQAPEITYTISFPNAVHHEAEVSITFTRLPAKPLELRMSRSSPGRYALHEFAKNVYNVRAYDAQGKPLAVTRPNEHQWNVTGHSGHVRVEYTLYGDRVDGTYAAIDLTHAHLNIPATFMFARGLGDRPIRVRFNVPDPSWTVATQLARTNDPFVFTAPNFQYFMDSPVELSRHEVRSWTVGSGARVDTIRLAIHHTGTSAEVDDFVERIKKVVQEQRAVFGEMPKFDYGSYTFIADYLPWANGDGMEHRNSTVLTSSTSLAQNAGGLLGTVSHEFFHAWNVERLRPKSLEPFDFERANMSAELWFAEGFTNYYGPLTLKRAGLTTLEQFARNMGNVINAVYTSPGRNYFSPAEMSMQAPFVDAATSIDPHNRANTFISYYTYGAALGLGLDLQLRTEHTNVTLDDFMRAMWARYGRTELPYTLDDWRRTLGQVIRDQAWADSFFNRHVVGKEVIDYGPLLERAGLLLRNAGAGKASLGPVSFTRDTGGVVIASNTLVGSPLYKAGLDRGDRIVSVNGRAVTSPDELQSVVAALAPGSEVTLEFESRGQRRNARAVLAEAVQWEVVPFEAAGRAVTEEMKALRRAWLGEG